MMDSLSKGYDRRLHDWANRHGDQLHYPDATLVFPGRAEDLDSIQSDLKHLRTSSRKKVQAKLKGISSGQPAFLEGSRRLNQDAFDAIRKRARDIFKKYQKGLVPDRNEILQLRPGDRLAMNSTGMANLEDTLAHLADREGVPYLTRGKFTHEAVAEPQPGDALAAARFRLNEYPYHLPAPIADALFLEEKYTLSCVHDGAKYIAASPSAPPTTTAPDLQVGDYVVVLAWLQRNIATNPEALLFDTNVKNLCAPIYNNDLAPLVSG